MNLSDVAEYVEDLGYGSQGKNLFIHHVPTTATKGIFLLSPLSGDRIDYELEGYKKTSFQVIVRDPNYQDGHELSKTLMKELRLANQDLASTHVIYMRPRHEPIVYPNSDGDYLEMSVNYDVCFYSLN